MNKYKTTFDLLVNAAERYIETDFKPDLSVFAADLWLNTGETSKRITEELYGGVLCLMRVMEPEAPETFESTWENVWVELQTELIMNEELEKTALEALKGVIETTASAKDFVLAEVPEVVEQLLTWKMWESLVYFSVSFFVAAITIALTWFWFSQRSKMHAMNQPRDHWMWFCYDDGECAIGGFICAVGFALSCIFFFSNLDWLQIWLAPKVYLIEYAANLM